MFDGAEDRTGWEQRERTSKKEEKKRKIKGIDYEQGEKTVDIIVWD